MNAVCVACGEPKELALARCAACGFVPTGDDRARSVLASTRMLEPPQLAEVQRRIRSGEPFRPSPARLAAARLALAGAASTKPRTLTRNEALALLAGNLLLTPALGWAVWFGLRQRPGLAARQALWLTVPVSGVLGGAWIAALWAHRGG